MVLGCLGGKKNLGDPARPVVPADGTGVNPACPAKFDKQRGGFSLGLNYFLSSVYSEMRYFVHYRGMRKINQRHIVDIPRINF